MTQKDSAPHLFEQPLQAPLSVIVSDYLGRVLTSLRRQTLPVEEWEWLLIQPGRIDSVRYLRLLLHSIKKGQFSMRCQRAASRGANGAAQYISTNRLRPLKYGRNSLRQEPRNVFPFRPSTC